jgi:hypothetical protein
VRIARAKSDDRRESVEPIIELGFGQVGINKAKEMKGGQLFSKSIFEMVSKTLFPPRAGLAGT